MLNEGSLQGVRVLVVEDEYFLADDLAQALKAAGAEPVGPAGSISEAEQYLDEGQIDAAVLDMNLRGRMGFDLASRIAADRFPCVIVSGYSEQALPPDIATLPRLEKPVSTSSIIALLASEIPASSKVPSR